MVSGTNAQKLGISSFAEQKQSEQNLFVVAFIYFFDAFPRQLIDSFAVEIGTLKKEMVRKREPPAAREHDDTHPPFG